jgi:hypothetical protein
MLAMSSGLSVGALLIGAAVSLTGVQHALLASGLAAMVLQTVIARR